MVAPSPNRQELLLLVQDLTRPAALTEVAVLAGCLAAAWAVVRLLRGRQAPAASIWFGRSVFDGVLFPVLALVLALVARRALLDELPHAVFRVAIPVLSSLALIRLTVKVLGAAFPQSHAMRLVERSVSWLAWIAVVLWITGVAPLVLEVFSNITFKVGSAVVSVRDVLEAAFTSVLMLVLALWVSSAIEAQLLKGSTGARLSVRKIAANTVRSVLLFIGLLLSLSAAGIDLTALSVLGGAIGVGLGFGLQKLAANYVSGFVVLAEQSVRIGDLVKVDGFEGRVTDIHTRYTVIRSLSGRESIVPNEMLITQRVENASLADTHVLASTVVQVAYGTDLDRLRPALAQAVAQVPRVTRPDEVAVQLTAFAADGLELTVSFWIADPERGQGGVRSDVNLAVLRTLEAQGVEIPFPQRVVRSAEGVPPVPEDGPAPGALNAPPPRPSA